MRELFIFDPAMCCTTGVCGPTVEPGLVRFAADVKWLKEQGVEVRRFSLSQNPAAFVGNDQVKQAIIEKGEGALPLLLFDGQVVASGAYPERAQLAGLLGLNGGETGRFTPAKVKEVPHQAIFEPAVRLTQTIDGTTHEPEASYSDHVVSPSIPPLPGARSFLL